MLKHAILSKILHPLWVWRRFVDAIADTLLVVRWRGAIERFSSVEVEHLPEKVGILTTPVRRVAHVSTIRLEIAVSFLALIRKIGLVLVTYSVAIA